MFGTETIKSVLKCLRKPPWSLSSMTCLPGGTLDLEPYFSLEQNPNKKWKQLNNLHRLSLTSRLAPMSCLGLRIRSRRRGLTGM